MLPALETAEFLLARIGAKRGARVRQAPRHPPLGCGAQARALRLFCDYYVAGVREPEARALIEWSRRPEMADILRAPATAREIVGLQARGCRCVGLLDAAPPSDGVKFALHDLRHMSKFFDPEHHRAQRGFFACVARALDSTEWGELERLVDDAWLADRDAVLADMNGSPVFLFSVLKMKLKMAARRLHFRLRGEPPPERGALDRAELASFEPLLELCLAGLALPQTARAAARAISCRRDAAPHARVFLEYFVGQASD